MFYEKLCKDKKKFERFTGIKWETFQQLCETVRPQWEQAETKRLTRDNRKRQIGAGNKYKLATLEQKVFILLLYYRLYLTYEFLELLVGIHNSNLSRLVRRLEPLLANQLQPRLPHLKKRIGSLKEFQQTHPELTDLIVDATEQKIQRPGGKKRQKKYYSGKKKQHTLKTQIIISQKTKQILHLSDSIPGSTHDFELLKQTNIIPKLPTQSKIHGDSGYQGAAKTYPQHDFSIPEKKAKGQERTPAQKKKPS